MKKFKEIMTRPITWGDVLKMWIWSMAGYLAVVLSFLGKLKYNEWKQHRSKKTKGYTSVKLDDPEDGIEYDLKD